MATRGRRPLTEPFLRLTERALLGLRTLALLDTASGVLTVNDLARLTGCSRDHVSKVIHALACEGLVVTSRGRRGGVRRRSGEPVRPSRVVEALEACLPRRDCFPCSKASTCDLRVQLAPATEAFLAVLDAGGLAPFAVRT